MEGLLIPTTIKALPSTSGSSLKTSPRVMDKVVEAADSCDWNGCFAGGLRSCFAEAFQGKDGNVVVKLIGSLPFLSGPNHLSDRFFEGLARGLRKNIRETFFREQLVIRTPRFDDAVGIEVKTIPGLKDNGLRLLFEYQVLRPERDG
jgi:hypothetical protein